MGSLWRLTPDLPVLLAKKLRVCKAGATSAVGKRVWADGGFCRDSVDLRPRRAPAAAPSGRGRAPEKQGFRWPGRWRPEDDGGGEAGTGRPPRARKG